MSTSSNDDVRAFIKVCREDPDLKAKILNSDEDEILKEAKSRGYTFKAEDLIAALDPSSEERVLDTTELEAIAGGRKANYSGVSCGLVCQTIRSIMSGESGCNPYPGGSTGLKGPGNKGPSMRRR